jgi:CubicO group peptidase (beta-lactamase class C family)
MKGTSLCLIFSLISFFSFSQQEYKTFYSELKKYEGIYEYANHLKVSIAASPKDTALVAIINQAKYPLKNKSHDVFYTQYDTIRFLRNAQNLPSAYISKQDTFKLISKNVFFPETMWYPRLKGTEIYRYEVPKNNHDGLAVDNISKTALDTSLLGSMMRKIIDEVYRNVHSILIIQDGKLVFEEYFYEYTKDSLHELRSATKSFVSALTGIAIDKGYIKSAHEEVLSYFPGYTLQNMSPLKKKITIANMLANASGLDCDISNDKSEGNEIKMDYSDDWVKFTLDLPMVDTPGGKGMYCSGNPITIGRIIEKATKQSLPVFAKEVLFDPLKINHFRWNFKPDKSNAEDFCQLYLTPREMAKLGLLYLNDGKWNNKQVVSAGWVKESFEKHSVVQGVNYGYLWWLKYLDAQGVRYYANAAQGNGGQKIYVFPQQNTVVVITGGNYNAQSPSDELIAKYILPAFNKMR